MESREKEIYRVTINGMIVNAVLVAIKFAAGILGRSAALVADAVHSLTDFVTDIVVLIFVRISGKPRDAEHEYRHGKFETFATMIIGVVLAGAGIGLMLSSARLIVASLNGETLPAPTFVALIVAVISIVSKELLYRYTAAAGKRLNSDAVIANAWHHRSDALSSVGTALGIGGAILLGSDWAVLDPIAALIVSVLIIRTALSLVRTASGELLEKSLPADVEKEIVDIAESEPEVSDVHNLCTRHIGSNIAIEMHLRMPGGITLSESHDHASSIERKLRQHFGEKTHISLHVEPRK